MDTKQYELLDRGFARIQVPVHDVTSDSVSMRWVTAPETFIKLYAYNKISLKILLRHVIEDDPKVRWKIIVNGKERNIFGQYLSFQNIIDLEYNGVKDSEQYKMFTVSYQSDSLGVQGSLSYNEKIKVVDGIIFNTAITSGV